MAKKILAMLLAAVLFICPLAACGEADPVPDESAQPTETPSPTPTPTAEPSPTPTPEPQPADTLSVAYPDVDGSANPFFTDSESGRVLLDLTQLSLLTPDRTGTAVLHAATGETVPYNGTDYAYSGLADVDVSTDNEGATYRITLREGVTFSDGTPVTADDVIFTYYTLLDPSYNGPRRVAALDIAGVLSYQASTPAELYDEYAAIFDEGYSLEAGHAVDVEACLKEAWMEDIQAIVDFCMDRYLADYADFTGYTAEEISANEGLQVMFAMWLWGFGEMTDDGQFRGSFAEGLWDLDTAYPTVEDCYNQCYARYEGDAAAYWRVEGVDNTDVITAARNLFVQRFASEDEDYVPVTSISGIVKVDERTVEITTETYASGDIYTLLDVYVAPMHHYGDASLYAPDAGTYGFPFGDLSLQQNAELLGAGVYVFNRFENNTVTLNANPNYYGGIPATPTIRIVGTGTRTAVEVLSQGLADIAFTDEKAEAEAAARYTDGAILTSVPLPEDDFVYIGLNADNVYVGSEEEVNAEASSALRRALAAVLAAGRDEARAAWYGDSAASLQYPLLDSGRLLTEGYFCYAADGEGNMLYTESTPTADRLSAAVEAAKALLIEAGYTWDEEQALFTEAPEGASLVYTVDYVGGGSGDNPCTAMLENAAVALFGIGITLDLNDLAYNTTLRETVNAGAHEIWVSELSCGDYEDLYRYFHSDNAAGQNYFGLESESADELILQIGDMTDEAQADDLTRQACEAILAEGVIIPCFRPSSWMIYSSTVDAATLPADITAMYPWTQSAASILMMPVPVA